MLFQRSMGPLRSPSLGQEAELRSFVGDISTNTDFVDQCFTSIHPWMPFLSKRNFTERVLNPLSPTQTENFLLLAAMMLLTMRPTDTDSQSAFYACIKATFLRAEARGTLDCTVVRAMILVAIYELGNAIYPAAYLTLGHCVQYGRALGVDKMVNHDLDSESNHDSVESEERRRSWWALFILDRFATLGCTERTPLLADPNGKSILPIDDGVWDEGIQFDGPFNTLSTPPHPTMGRFCLTTQAAILIGRISRNIQDDHDHGQFLKQEAQMLDDTIIALTKVSLHEGRSRGIGICSPTTLCYRERFGRYRLDHTSSSSNQTDVFETEIVHNMLRLAQSLSTAKHCGAEENSPFCLDAMYRTGIFYARKHKTSKSQNDLEAFNDIKNGLLTINNRWKAASIYVQMLDARRLTGIL